MRVLVCLDPVPAPDGTCAETAWLEHPSAWPQLTVDQGREIGQAILLALIAVAAVKVFLNPKTHRSNA